MKLNLHQSLLLFFKPYIFDLGWLCYSFGAKYISNQLGIWSELRLFVRSVICSILLFPPPSVSAIGRTGIFWPVAAQGRGEGANLNNGGGQTWTQKITKVIRGIQGAQCGIEPVIDFKGWDSDSNESVSK